jgi:hypothetical protein
MEGKFMKINQSQSSNMVSNQNMQQTEQKETASTNTVHQDRFETLPPRNDTIGGGYQRKEVAKGKDSKPDGSTSESQPEAPAWLKGKEQGRGIGWGREVRPKDTSGTSVGNSGDKAEKVNLDYFDKQNQMKKLIGGDESSLKNLDRGDGTTPGESKEPGRKNQFEGMEGGVPRGYGKNKSSKQEQTSMFPVVSVPANESSKGTASPIPYPANKTETSEASKVKISDPTQKEKTIPSTTGNEAGSLKGVVSSSTKGKQEFVNFSFDILSPTTGNSTPLPDAVDESHRPKPILAEEKPKRKDLATNHDKVELHDENKRQQEKVYVEREEIFGSMVGRMTDGRSTPAPTDGTTDSAGPRQSTGTGGVDLESKHRKGDPGDGDEA